MPTVSKINETLFSQIKASIEIVGIDMTIAQYQLSRKTIVQIANSDTYENYQEQVKAQHPPTQFSMRDAIVQIAQSQKRIEEKIDQFIAMKIQSKLF